MSKLKSKLAPVHVPAQAPAVLKLDFGCGKGTPEGWEGIDALDFGQKHVFDLRKTPWPWKDQTVDEVRSNHFLEHLTGSERVSFFNELYRVMKVGATAHIVTPNWSHSCAYGDPTHQWPPMSFWYPLYLNKEWRKVNAPHCGYVCDFNHTIVGTWDQSIAGRNQEYIANAMNQQTNAFRDLIAILTRLA